MTRWVPFALNDKRRRWRDVEGRVLPSLVLTRRKRSKRMSWRADKTGGRGKMGEGRARGGGEEAAWVVFNVDESEMGSS